MTSGFVYIMSNPCLNGLLKIGMTKDLPEMRARSLSRSTAIPADFKVEYSRAVAKFYLLERRMHLLFGEKRYNDSKEFFSVSLSEAVDTLDKIVLFMDSAEGISEGVAASPILINSMIGGKLSLKESQFLYLLMAATEGNTTLAREAGMRPGIVDGFLDCLDVCNYRGIKKEHARRMMKNFCMKHQGLTVPFDFTSPFSDMKPHLDAAAEINVFDKLVYCRGQMAWVFSGIYRDFFVSDKSELFAR